MKTEHYVKWQRTLACIWTTNICLAILFVQFYLQALPANDWKELWKPEVFVYLQSHYAIMHMDLFKWNLLVYSDGIIDILLEEYFLVSLY